MDARIPRDETSLLLSPLPRPSGEVDAIRLAAIRARDAALAAMIRRAAKGLWVGLTVMAQAIAAWPQRRRIYDELSSLTDRELADIGLTRADIPRVFDTDFPVRQPRPANEAAPVIGQRGRIAAQAA